MRFYSILGTEYVLLFPVSMRMPGLYDRQILQESGE